MNALPEELQAIRERDEWRVIPQHPRYEVSSIGNVRRTDSKRPMKPRLFRGYWKVGLTDGPGLVKQRMIHQLVLFAFVGPRPPGLIACHNNGIPTDNTPSNLRWDTHQSNEDDKVKHGTKSDEERHGRTHLSRADVLQMRALFVAGTTSEELAKKFNISRDHVPDIVHGFSWRKVPGAVPIPPRNEAKTHCKRGHELTEANTYRFVENPVWKGCLICRAWYRVRRKAERAALGSQP